MRDSIELDPRAESNEFARRLRHRFERSLRERGRRHVFRGLFGTVVVVCRSSADRSSAAVPAVTLTLRFDYGRLAIHAGRVGRPDVTLWGTEEEILPGAVESRARLLRLTGWLSRGVTSEGARIFGRFEHPRLVLGLARLLEP